MGVHWEQTKKRIFGYDKCTSRVILGRQNRKEKKIRFLLGIGSESYLSPMFDILLNMIQIIYFPPSPRIRPKWLFTKYTNICFREI
jgi:hypothetical protein